MNNCKVLWEDRSQWVMYLTIGLTIYPVSISFISNPLLSSRLNFLSTRGFSVLLASMVRSPTIHQFAYACKRGIRILLPISHVLLSSVPAVSQQVLSFRAPLCPSMAPSPPIILTGQLRFLPGSFLAPLWSGPYSLVTMAS